jgi:hypothetical protein
VVPHPRRGIILYHHEQKCHQIILQFNRITLLLQSKRENSQ